MNEESVIYLTNIVIGVILASLATRYWLEQRQSGTMQCWAAAAWILVVADVLFAMRPVMAFALGRLLPTLCVTAGHIVLLLGAQRTAGLKPQWRLPVVVAAIHAAGLTMFLLIPSAADFRMVLNGVIWGSFSVASALCLRRGSRHFWASVFAPATAFWAHAGFHGLRVVLALPFAATNWHGALDVLQIAGDLEVSFFMVALFVGLLIAHLQIRHDELMQTRAEVHTLSGLLPICAWCKKIRNDEGYWQQVDDYFTAHSSVKFTHGVCLDCMGKVNELTVARVK
jgi:hypothetical protein